MPSLGFFKKEMAQMVKTSRLVAVTAVFLFFGLLSPLSARYINEILASVAGGIQITLPTPTFQDAWLQYFKNLSSICLIVFTLTLTGSVAAEKSKGSVLLVLTKQVSRTDFLLSKMAAGMLLYTFAYLVSLAACLYYAMVIFPDATSVGLPLALAAMWAQGLFFAVFAVFVSTIAPSPTVAATLGFAGYAVLSIPTMFPGAVKFIPTGLTTLANGLLAGTALTGDVVFALAASAVLSLLLAGGAVFIFKRQEL